MHKNLKIAGVVAVAASLLYWLSDVETDTRAVELDVRVRPTEAAETPEPAMEPLVAAGPPTSPAPAAPAPAAAQAPPVGPPPEPTLPEPSPPELAPFDLAALQPAKRRFTSNLKLRLVDLSVGGNAAGLPAEMDVRVAQEYEVAVTDVPFQIGFGGRPGLHRTFDVVRADMRVGYDVPGGGGPADTRAKGLSPLQGLTVEFIWDVPGRRWNVAYAPSVGLSSMPADVRLSDLEQDLDLTVFAPPPGLAPGGTWSIAPRALQAWLVPGGDLGLAYDSTETDAIGFSSTGFWSLAGCMEQAEGMVTATLESRRGPANASLVAIGLEFELDLAGDELLELPEEVQNEVDSTVHLTYEIGGTAEIEWDDSTQRVTRLTAEADVTLATSLAILGGGGAGAAAFECDYEGKATWAVTSKSLLSTDDDGR